MSDQDLKTIAAKIAAIEALANGGATDGEIAAATAAINRLLTRYNISIERARAIAGETESARQRAEAVKSNRYSNDAGKRFQWEIDLAEALAQAHYCKLLTQGAAYLFIGKPHNASAAITIFARLRDVLSSMASAHVKAYSDYITANTLFSPKELKGSQSLRAVRLSYLAGAVRTIADRLAEQRRADNAEFNGEVTALVRVEDAAIKEFLADWKIHTRAAPANQYERVSARPRRWRKHFATSRRS